MFTLIDYYDVQATRREAREKAKMEAMIEAAKTMLNKGFSVDLIMEITKLTKEQIEALQTETA